jgi:DNA-binding MarR family transcriptional regulator
MVEDKYSVNTVLSFGARSINPEILEKLLIGRTKAADYLFDAVKSIAEYKNNQQILVIGQRGMGKTHLLRSLHHRIQDYINDDKIVVAYFSEEEYGVSDYLDFLIRIINSFIKWNDKDKNYLLEKMSDLQETQPKSQVNVAEKIIEDYIGKRALIILAENFSDILESIKVKDQGKVRAWLYKVNRVNIIATSQALSDDFDREDRPFYGFFNTYYLKNLSYEESLDFLVSLATVENRTEVIEFLQTKGRSQVKALHQLVKGNHRLLVTFYEFLKSDTLSNLSKTFIKTINDLKPYYETYIRYLPPQQQKILRYIALTRKPQQGTDISKNCFIDQKSLSKQLSELARKNLLEVITDPDDKRNKLYDINEPLLRISIEVGEHREGISAIFIDFLAIYYDNDDLEGRKRKFAELKLLCESEIEKQNLDNEIYAIDKALELKESQYPYLNSLEITKQYKNLIDEGKYDELFEILKTKNILDKKETLYLNISKLFFERKEYDKSLEMMEKAIEQNSKDENILIYAGINSLKIGKEKNNIEVLEKSLNYFNQANTINPSSEYLNSNWAIALYELAKIKKDENLYTLSIEKFELSGHSLESDAELNYLFGLALKELGKIKTNLSLEIRSFEHFNKAKEINPKNYAAHLLVAEFLLKKGMFFKDFNVLNECYENLKIGLKASSLIEGIGILMQLIKYLSKFENEDQLFNRIVPFLDLKIYDEKVMQYIYYNLDIVKEFLSILKINAMNNIAFENIKYKYTNPITPFLFMSLSGNFKVFKYCLENNTSLKKLTSILGEWIISILSISENLTSEDLKFLKETIEPHLATNPELSVANNYIGVYKKYVIEGRMKAIYDLTKEQRLFFKSEILNIK